MAPSRLEVVGAEVRQNHRRINEIIKRQLGPAVAAQLQAVEDQLDAEYRRFSTEKSRRFNLVSAEGFEAMTCAMALTMLEEAAAGEQPGSDRFGGWQQLRAWHAAGEIEHRTVAFDVYHHLEDSYAHRVAGSLRAHVHFHRTVDAMQRIIVQRPARRPRESAGSGRR